MMFHVVHRLTGEVATAKGFFAVCEEGCLYDVQDGWNCEGGGGSEFVGSDFIAVLGPSPVVVVEEAPPRALKPFKCGDCGKRFTTELGWAAHALAKGHSFPE